MGQPTRPSQPFNPSGSVITVHELWDGAIKRQTRAGYGCLVAGESPVATGLAYARSVCDTTAPLQQQQLPLVALCKYFALTLTFSLLGISSRAQNEKQDVQKVAPSEFR